MWPSHFLAVVGYWAMAPNPLVVLFVLLCFAIACYTTLVDERKKKERFSASLLDIYSPSIHSLAGRVHVVNFFMGRYLLLGYITSDCTIVRFSPVCVYVCECVWTLYEPHRTLW